MTTAEKSTAIAERMARLQDLRAELTIAMSKQREALAALIGAGLRAEIANRDSGKSGNIVRVLSESWPAPSDIQKSEAVIATLRREADTLLSELRGLGGDQGLFYLNDSVPGTI